MRRNRMIFAFPTSDDLFAIFVAWPIDALPQVRANVEAAFLETIDDIPELAARVRSGRREERFQGAAYLPNFFRRPYGPGWALVGDAGCHKDPYLALGICDAFRDVDGLVDAVDEWLSGRGDLQQALARYERERNDAGHQGYDQNLHGAHFNPPPEELMRARAAIRGNQDAINRFFLVREGMIPAAPPYPR